MRGTLLEPHEGVASGAQRQASDPVSPLLLRTVTITKARQHNDRLAGFFHWKMMDELVAWKQIHVHLTV